MVSLESSLIGKTIDGRFRITRHLGTGGMGTAFEAVQLDLNRQVCLKFLKSDALSSLDSVQRFKREARVLASLHHKNIVECFSCGIYDSIYPYLALEFVEGVSLHTLAQQETLEWTRVVRLLIQVCEALSYAHQKGFIHRDIKPANVMVVNRGSDNNELVKLVDFGLVGKQQGEFVFDTLTDPQTIIGSVNYMPPEAFRGSVADASLDVYAVGCLLYEALSGQLPFEAENPIAVMFKHTTERLPNLPESIEPDRARRALNELIHKATEADQSARLKSCEQIREHLLEILEQQSGSSFRRLTENEYELRSEKDLRKRSSRKWLVPVMTAIVMILATTIATQINLRSSVSEKNILLLQGPGEQKQVTSKDSRITFNDALNRFRSIVRELEGTSGAKSKETANSFRAFLEQYSFALRTDNTEVQKLAETASTKLSKLRETTQDPNTRTQLFELQCDLLTSLGYYDNTLDLLKMRDSRPVRQRTSGLHKGGQEELVKLHDYVLGDNKKESDRFLLERLRPAAAFYPNLKDEGKRFFRLVNQLNNAEKEDHWSPRLIEIADKVSSHRDERLVQHWIELCQISLRSAEPELGRSLLPKIRKEMTRYPIASIDQVATLYDRLDKTEEGLRIIQDACEAARRRGEHFQWCLWSKAAIEILARRGRREEAGETLQRVLSSVHWGPDRYDKHRNFEWFDLVYRFSNLSFELQDYSSFLKLYNHAMIMRTEPDFEERCLEISVNYVRLLWRMNRDREANGVIKGELARATAPQKLRFAEILCDMSVRPDTVKNRIRIIPESTSILTGVLKACGKLDADTANRCKKSILNANLNLADAYLSDCQWKKATDVYLQIIRGDFGKISEQEKATYLGCILHARRYAGDADGCRKAAAEILETLRKNPVWATPDYGIFENALSEYVAVEASHGDLRRAKAFLNTQVTQFSDMSPQQCYLQALEAHCSLWGQRRQLELGCAQLEKAYQYLGALPSPDSQQVQFYGAVKSLIANRLMDLGDCERAKTLLKQVASQECPSSLRVIDAYCSLAQLAYWRGDYEQALSALQMASTLPASDLDKAIRTNFSWARVLATQGNFHQALEKIDQLRTIVEKEQDLDDRERNLIRVEVAYNAIYKQWKRPAEGQEHLEKAKRLLESELKKRNHYLRTDVVGGLLSADAEIHHNLVHSREFLEGIRNLAVLKLWGKNDYDYATGLCYYRIAKLYRRQNQDGKALKYLRQAIRFDRGYSLSLAEVEAAVGDKAAAALDYQAALDRAQHLVCSKNPVHNVERAGIYLSYACWLHDKNEYAQAKQYAEQAITLLSHVPGIYNRNYVGLTWMAAESDATLRNLKRLAKWYTLEQQTLQRLISAQDQQESLANQES